MIVNNQVLSLLYNYVQAIFYLNFARFLQLNKNGAIDSSLIIHVYSYSNFSGSWVQISEKEGNFYPISCILHSKLNIFIITTLSLFLFLNLLFEWQNMLYAQSATPFWFNGWNLAFFWPQLACNKNKSRIKLIIFISL